jgi:hypothetical protein
MSTTSSTIVTRTPYWTRVAPPPLGGVLAVAGGRQARPRRGGARARGHEKDIKLGACGGRCMATRWSMTPGAALEAGETRTCRVREEQVAEQAQARCIAREEGARRGVGS